MLGQIIRFGIAGGLSTVVYSAVYLPLTAWVLPKSQAVLAVPPSILSIVVRAGCEAEPAAGAVWPSWDWAKAAFMLADARASARI